MDKKALDRKQILKGIENGKISKEEGFNLLKSLKEQQEDTPSTSKYFKPVWQLTENISVNSSIGEGDYILLDENTELFQELKGQVAGESRVVLVRPATGFSKIQGDIYGINIANAEDYERLLEELKNRGISPKFIIHQLSKGSPSLDEKGIEEELKSGPYSLLYLTKAMMTQRIKEQVQLIYIYGKEGNEANPLQAAVGGFAKSVALEAPNFQYRTIDICRLEKKENQSKIVNLLLQEFATGEKGRFEVKYEGDQRYIRHLKALDLPSSPNNKIPFKTNGVYLITGGTGGLGLIFAEHMAKKHQSTILLVGRSELTVEKQEMLKKLSNCGGKVEYIRGDISDPQRVEVLMADIKHRFGKIDGVLHTAGVLRDSFILRKTSEDMEVCLKAKVYGTIFLHRALQRENLDFFVMFSSTAALMGNLGQSDYAYANSFMDHFAETNSNQNQTPLMMSINWPLWRDGGMKVDEESIKLMKEAQGLLPLSNEKGIKTLEDGIRYGLNRVAVFEGTTEALENLVKPQAEVKTIDYNVAELSKDEEAELIKKTEDFLKQVLHKEMKIPLNKIKSHEAFEKYGIDSLMVINLTKELEAHFGELSKTLFFEYQNIQQLRDYFIENHQEKLMSKLNFTPKATTNTKPMASASRIESASTSTGGQKAPSKGRRFVNTEESTKRNTTTNRTTNSTTNSNVSSNTDTNGDEDIAIIGLSGRYPKAKNVDEFWENLKAGKDCVTEIPEERWDWKKYYDEQKGKRGKSYSKWGGFIDDVDKFDPMFFNISPLESSIMDPQERLFLQTVWETMEDAGYRRSDFKNSKVGVFVGVMYGHYQLFGAEDKYQKQGIIPVSSYATVANRVSYFFDFHGPSIGLDTMCSSSLTTLHLACESIRRGDSQLAFAGGVNVSIHPNKYIMLSQGGFASTDGKCRSFGEGGDGYVPGEGVGAVLLKPLKQAVADGDHIYAIVKGSSLNHGGKTNGYSVPNPNAQGDLILETLEKTQIDPRKISYIEAHGTGTSLGDPIEITGLMKAFGKYTKEKQYCSIGSVKANIGHLESAAGIAGITKVLLQMKHRTLVPSIHSDIQNPNINFNNSAFYVQRGLEEWKQPVLLEDGEERIIPRYAGISSFGAGGANAHVILQEYIQQEETQKGIDGSHIITLSARNQERLREYANKMANFINKNNWGAKNPSLGNSLYEEQLAEDILDSISSVLNIHQGNINLEDNINEFGLDPMELTKVANRINERFGTDLPQMILSQYSSLAQFINTFAQEYRRDLELYYNNSVTLEWRDGDSELNLSDMAYTLAVGREAMEERISLVVENLAELYEKLKRYANGGKDIEGLYQANIKKNSSKYDLLINGKAGQEFLRAVIQEKEYEKLAELWVSGVEMDWGLIYQGESVKRISLPTYPFEKERCWIPDIDALENTETTQKGNNVFDLLLDKFDMRIVDESNEEILKLMDLKMLDTKVEVKKTIKKPTQYLLRKQWQESVTKQGNVAIEGSLVLLVNRETVGLIKDLFNGNRKINKVLIATEDQQQVDYYLDPKDAEAGNRISKKVLDQYKDIIGIVDLSDIYSYEIDTVDDCMGKITLLQNLIRGVRVQPLHILHITKGLQTFNSSFNTLQGGAFAGLVKNLGAEYKKLQSRTIDIDYGIHQWADVEELILNEMVIDDLIGDVCYRKGVRYIPYMNSDLRQDYNEFVTNHQKCRVNVDRPVVVTGGTRGIGAEVAKHMLKNGVSKIVIMGNQAIPERSRWQTILQGANPKDSNIKKIQQIMALEELGAKVEVYTGALTDEDKLTRFFNDIRSKWGSIGGVVHCAGLNIIENPAFINKKPEDMGKVFEPKIKGLQTLHRVFEKDSLEFFILFSSVSALIPVLGAGVMDYGTANSFMDYFANYQYAKGNTYYKSINWPNWKQVGMGEVETPAYKHLGLTALTTEDGLFLLNSVLEAQGQAAITPCISSKKELNGQEMLWTRQEIPPMMAPEKKTEVKKKNPPKTIEKTVGNPGKPTGDTKAWMKELFSQQLMIPIEKLDEDTQFGDFGVDSILLAELVKKMEEKLVGNLDPSILIEYPTIESLSEYLDENNLVVWEEQQNEAMEEVAVELEQQEEEVEETIVKEEMGEEIEEESVVVTVKLPQELKQSLTKLSQQSDTKHWDTKEGIEKAKPKVQKYAIIGIGCHFPGSMGKEEYWNNLSKGKSGIVEVPLSRWDKNEFYSPTPQSGKIISKWGGFVDSIEYFDPDYFKIPIEQAPYIDPLIRQVFEVSIDTIRDAGYEEKELWNKPVGVFIGARAGTFAAKIGSISKNSVVGIGQNFIAAHLAHFLNLKGPNLVVDTACSSSIVSVHLACQSLLLGECDVALAGGVDILIDEKAYLILSEGGALSPDGQCHTFDEKANGFVPGEGCGMVMIKTLEKAIEDGDQIYAVIDSSAVNNDGHTMGITTPNPEEQRNVIRAALEKGQVDATSVSYIEAHGTGTMIGDPIELKALTKVFREYTDETQFCGVGSVKTNIGHLLSAAGVASIIKVALSVNNKQLPPTLNCNKPNPRFKFDQSPFFPNTSLRQWEPKLGIRRAGISSFGFGGTNAHMLISEPEQENLKNYVQKRHPLQPVEYNRRRFWIDDFHLNGQPLKENKEPEAPVSFLEIIDEN